MEREKAIPIRWMAPEVLKFTNTLKFSEASDVWAYGITIWEIYTLGEQPYFEFNLNEARMQILCCVTPKIPDWCPPMIKEIMANCWNFHPRERWSFHEISSKFKEHDENFQQSPSISSETNEILLTENAQYFLVYILFLLQSNWSWFDQFFEMFHNVESIF